MPDRKQLALGLGLCVLLSSLSCTPTAPNKKASDKMQAMTTVTLADACDAILRDLNIPKDSFLGKHLAARDLNCDEQLGVCSVSGQIDINLKERGFRILEVRGADEIKRHPPWITGKLYFDRKGILRADILE